MNGNFKVTLTSNSGLFKPVQAVGVSLEYSINNIPQLQFDLPPTANDVFCDFDKYRRSSVSVEIKTPTGCTDFLGLLDGVSVSQTNGNIALSLNIKHEWQMLAEIDTRFPGYHPTTTDVFLRVKGTSKNKADNLAGVMSAQQLNRVKTELGDNKTVIEAIKGIAIALLKSKETFKAVAKGTKFPKLIKELADAISATYFARGLYWLDKIDTSFTNKCKLLFSQPEVNQLIVEQLSLAGLSLHELILRMCRLLECNLIITNNKAYILPDIGFLTVKKYTPGHREVSDMPNIFYPAQYTSFLFNDVGTIDIKGVGLMILATVTTSGAVANEYGYYVDPNAKGGVTIVPGGVMSSLGVNLRLSKEQQKIQTETSSGGNTSKVAEPTKGSATTRVSGATETKKSEKSEAQKQREFTQEFANEWAKITYLRMKYRDRGGSISLPLNFNVAPGAIGTLYTRNPGIFIDFFVTSVRHELRMGAPAQGEATTQIQFNSGRVGESKSFSSIDIFQFSGDDSLRYAKDFVNSTMTS